MARRHPPPDPELAALARDRLARLLGGGGDAAGPRRAAGVRGGGREGRAALLEPDPYDPDLLDPDPSHPDPSHPGRRVGPEDLEPPRRFTRWHLAVVAAVLLLGAVWAGWSWVQARPEAVAAPTVSQAPAAPAGTPAVGAPTAGPAPSIPSAGAPSAGSGGSGGNVPQAAGPVVHVLGAVRRPGLVHLPAGARVEDALEAAGGLRRDADPGELNLAQPLDDGVQVVVGTRAHPAGEVRSGGAGTSSGSGGSSGSSGSGGGSGAVVDLNRASVDQLDALPGVGPVTAQKILDWREQHGRFSRTEELQEVDGIGPKTYARLAPHVRV